MIRVFGSNGGYDRFFGFGVGFGNDLGICFFSDKGNVAKARLQYFCALSGGLNRRLFKGF
jgi:hypothetical protein